ncbi:MAG: LptF/LptG family permease [bacterium]|nr:LptF/LptG family permease [bacterium]
MRFIRIIDRYVFAEAFGLFMLGFFGFLSFLVVNKLFLEVQDLLDNSIPPFAVIKAVLLEGPNFATWSLPVATLFGTLMSMGRLAKDNELTAMFTNGLSLYRLFLPFLLLSSIAVLSSFLINEYLVTRAAQAQQRIYDQFPRLRGRSDGEMDPFIVKLANGEFVTASYFDKTQGRLRNVMFDDWDHKTGKRFTTAEQGFSDGNMLTLGVDQRSPATVFNKNTKQDLYDSASSEPSLPVSLGLDLKKQFTDLKTPQELTTSELARQTRQKAAVGESSSVDATDWHLRFSGAFASLAFALVAMPLSLKAPRDERLLGLIFSFLLVMLYYLLYFMGKMMGYNEVLPPWLGAWMMNIVFGFIALGVFAYSRK